MSVLAIVTALSTVLMTGNEAAVLLFVDPALQETGDHAVTQWLAVRLGRVMPFWYGLNLLLLLAACLHPASAGNPLPKAAAILWSAVIVYTLIALVPLNNRVAASSEGDHGWREVHLRWHHRHAWRVAALVVSVTCYLAAAVR